MCDDNNMTSAVICERVELWVIFVFFLGAWSQFCIINTVDTQGPHSMVLANVSREPLP